MRHYLEVLMLSLGVILIVFGCADHDRSAVVAQLELASIRSDLEVYDGLRNDDKGLKLKLAKSMLGHAVLVAIADPDIRSVKGEPLETLCMLTEPKSQTILSDAGDQHLFELVSEYLEEVRGEVETLVKENQKAMRGKGCFLSPN